MYTSPQIEPMLGYTVEEWVDGRRPLRRAASIRRTASACSPHTSARTRRASRSTSSTASRTRDGRTSGCTTRPHDRDADGSRCCRDTSSTSRPEGGRGAASPPGLPRPADGAREPCAVHGPRRARARRPMPGDASRRALPRPRRLQGGQRQLGHPAGDALLRAVGVRLRARSRRAHRRSMGGDEFAILVEDATRRATAVDAAERIIGALQAPFDVEGREVFVTASVGIARRRRRRGAAACRRRRDVRRQGEGKAQYVVYAPRMDERPRRPARARRRPAPRRQRRRVRPPLPARRRARERARRRRRGARPLATPDARRCSSRRFHPLAEETGKIVDIGRWVLARGVPAGRALARGRSRRRPVA